MCLIHEQVVQRKGSLLGNTLHTNLTIVRIHNCPVYTRCCELTSGCCFDYPWFWSSFAIVLCTLLISAVLSVYYWHKRKREAAVHSLAGFVEAAPLPPGASTAATTTTANAGIVACALSRFSGPRTELSSRSPDFRMVGCPPKPPAYSPRSGAAVETTTTPSFGPSLPPPPYHQSDEAPGPKCPYHLPPPSSPLPSGNANLVPPLSSHPGVYVTSSRPPARAQTARSGQTWSRVLEEAPPPYTVFDTAATAAAATATADVNTARARGAGTGGGFCDDRTGVTSNRPPTPRAPTV